MRAPTLILASASPARAALLRSAGVEPVIRPADVDEDAILAEAAIAAGGTKLPVPEAVALLARAKAEAIVRASQTPASQAQASAPINGRAVIVGCDSLLELDGEGLGKPHTAQRARERWRQMRGRQGALHTGHHVVRLDSGATVAAVSSTVVHFADISDAELDAYVATGEPLAVAGAFTLDGLGGAFVTGIDGDPHGVVGLSLPLLRTMLAEIDVAWVDLWHQKDR